MTLVALAALTVSITSAACSPSEDRGPRRIAGWAVSDGGQLQVLIETCNGDAETDVVESDDAITVTVVSTRHDPGDDCLDVVNVPLSSPLEGREVIDGLSGREAPSGLTRDHLQP